MWRKAPKGVARCHGDGGDSAGEHAAEELRAGAFGDERLSSPV